MYGDSGNCAQLVSTFLLRGFQIAYLFFEMNSKFNFTHGQLLANCDNVFHFFPVDL